MDDTLAWTCLLQDQHYWELSGRFTEHLCSAEKIPEPSNQFDAIFGVAVFYHIPEIHKTLRECYRTLKPGGRLLMFDYPSTVTTQLKIKASQHHYNHWNFLELKKLLSEAGFSKINQHIPISQKKLLRLYGIRHLRNFWKKSSVDLHWLIVEATK